MAQETTNENPEVRIFTPPNILKHKVGSGGISKEDITKAEWRLEAAKNDFDSACGPYLMEVEQLFTVIEDYPSVQIPTLQKTLEKLNFAIFELKGMGGFYGKPSVTHVANSLYTLIENIEVLNATIIEAINVHKQALNRSLNEELPESVIVGLKGVNIKALGKDVYGETY